jgi:hypothetical protein
LVPIGSFDDLHQRAAGPRSSSFSIASRGLVVALPRDCHEVGDVQEGGALQADVDEGRSACRAARATTLPR